MFRTFYRWIALSAPIPLSSASPNAVCMASASPRFCYWWALRYLARPMQSGSIVSKSVKNETKNPIGCSTKAHRTSVDKPIKKPAAAGFLLPHCGYCIVSTLTVRSSADLQAAAILANCACHSASASCQASAFSIDSAEECTSTDTNAPSAWIAGAATNGIRFRD